MENDNVITMGTGKTPSTEKIAKALDNNEIPERILAQAIDNEFPVIEDVVELPSKGIFYKNKQSQLRVRHLTTEDDNILNSPELIRSGKVLDALLDNAIIDKTLKAEEMLVGDRNAALLFLRTEGLGDEYEVKMLCPSCTETYETVVLISDLKHKELTVMPDADLLFSTTLPKSNWKVKFRLLTGKDEATLSLLADKVAVTKNNITYSPLLTERYILQVMDVQGKTDKGQIKKAVQNMPLMDSAFLRKYIQIVEPGINMEHNFTCKHCQHKYEDTVPVTARLFWPNAKI